MIEHVRPKVPLPAIQGQFGPRLLTYTTQLPPAAIETILGHDPRSQLWKRLPDDINQIYTHLQRVTTKKRLDSIIRYIRYRFTKNAIVPGAFPAISIAVQNPTEFEKIEGPFTGVGVLQFDLSRRNLRIVVDGLGRASAAMELVEWSESAELPQANRDALKKLLEEFSLPTVFYMPAQGQAPLSIDEMQQLFHDFNFKVTAVPARMAIALDHSDLYIGLTNRIGDAEPIASHGGMEFKAASLGKKSTAIVVQQNLLRFVRGGIEGEAALEGTANSEMKNPNLTEETMEKYQEELITFLTAIADSMGSEAFADRERLHLTAPGWQVLGALFHDLAVRLKVPDLEAAAARIGAIDWRRAAPIWKDVVRERDDGTLGLTAGGGSANRRAMLKAIRQELKIDELLRERGFTDDDAGVVAPVLVPNAESDAA